MPQLIRTEHFDIIPKHIYRYHVMRKVKRDGETMVEDVKEGLYRVLGFAQEARTLMQLVVYRGLDGKDLNQLFVCSPYDFSIHFLPEEVPPVAEEKVLDLTDKGPGY